MKKKQCRIELHKIPIYGAKLHVVQARDFVPAWNALFPKAPTAKPGCYGLAWFDCATLTGYVGLESSANGQTIAHEALHIAHDLLRTIGHKSSYDNNEAECYLLGYLVRLLTPDKNTKLKPYPVK